MPIVLSSSWEAAAIASIGAKMPAAKARAWQQTAGRFLFKHRRCGHHVRHISELYEKMGSAVRTSIKISDPDEDVFSGYSGPLLEELYYNLDGFLEAMRSAHDSSLSWLSSANLLLEPPHSFHDFQKTHAKQSTNPNTCDKALRDVLVSFWSTTGKVTKEYRDCLSHYVSLSGPTWQHSANAVFKQGTWTFSIHLPDNPQARTYSALEFTGRVDALSLCQRLHEESEVFVRAVLTRCAEKWQTGPIDMSSTRMTVANVVVGN